MLGLLKVLVVVAVIAVVGGLATHWVKDKAISEIHRTVDTSLPGKVSGHPWAPLSHDKAVKSAKVRFVDGSIRTVRCHETLGTYSANITHDFTFTKTTSPLKAGCPGRQLALALMAASRYDVTTQGRVDTLTITGSAGKTVATLRGRHS
ncbi:MAG: hypothetical protein QM747_00880 [Nocardioides sp.]